MVGSPTAVLDGPFVGDVRQCAAFELVTEPVALVLWTTTNLCRDRSNLLRYKVRRDGVEGEIVVEVDPSVWNHLYTRAKGVVRIKGSVHDLSFPEELPRAHGEYKHASVEVGPNSQHICVLSI